MSGLTRRSFPFAFVVADTVYGSNQDLRDWLELHGYHFVLAVACDEPVEIMTPQGRTRMTVTQAQTRFLQAHDWHQLSMGKGTRVTSLLRLGLSAHAALLRG